MLVFTTTTVAKNASFHETFFRDDGPTWNAAASSDFQVTSNGFEM